MKSWVEMDEKNKNIIVIIIGISLITVFLVYSAISGTNKIKKEAEISEYTQIVKDNSRYFTVMSCANKYFETLISKNTDNILLLLNNEYKKEFGINKNNISNYIPKLDDDLIYNYVGKEMYSKQISKNVIEYYIKGQIKGTEYEGVSTYKDYDLTVILYENTLTFSIRPGVKL